MSFILKALKKLEEENAAQRVRPHDINSALLTADRSPEKITHRPLKWSIMLLLFIAGSGAIYLLVHQSHLPLSRIQNQTLEESHRDDKAVQPSAPAPSPPNLRADVEKKSAAERAAPDQQSAMPVSPEKRYEAGKPPPRSSRSAKLPMTEQASREPSKPAPSGLIVNGIALQDDPSASVAVINGILVRRGMTIQGVKIEEIFHDRVRFTGNGETYEVPISR